MLLPLPCQLRDGAAGRVLKEGDVLKDGDVLKEGDVLSRGEVLCCRKGAARRDGGT